MIEITTLDQFNESVKEFKSTNGKTVTNCFLMPGEISSLAAEGKLFISLFPQWLFVVCDREDYSNLYYYTTAASDTGYVKEFLSGISDKQLYMDIVSRMGRGDSDTPERLIDSGNAKRYKTYQRMHLPLKNISFDTLTVSVAEGYKISTNFCDYNSLINLWKETLDEKSTPLPKEEELVSLCREGNLFTVLDNEENLAAVIMLSVNSKQGLLQHLAVSNQHRRKGLAISLMNKAFITAQQSGLTTLRLWVDCQNSSAITLYDRLSFEKDGMICDQLYMKGN